MTTKLSKKTVANARAVFAEAGVPLRGRVLATRSGDVVCMSDLHEAGHLVLHLPQSVYLEGPPPLWVWRKRGLGFHLLGWWLRTKTSVMQAYRHAAGKPRYPIRPFTKGGAQ